LPPIGRVLEPSPSSKEIRSARRFSPSDSPTPRFTMTYEPSHGLCPTPRASKIGGYSSPMFRPTLEQAVNASPSFQAASHANPSALRENVRALVTSVSSGTRCCGLYARYSPFGFWERTSVGCFPLMEVEPSEPSCMNWPKWGTAWDGACTELATSVLRIEGNGSSLLPTPQAFDAKDVPDGNQEERRKKGGCRNLAQEVKMWPAPASRDHKGTGDCANVPVNGLLGRAVSPSVESGSLNPQWVEWLQGFPPGWTDLEHSETP
jgi:hypothetical protein